jgi:hypothetical protein
MQSRTAVVIHLTIASSSFDCSTVPSFPVGFPKLPKPSTRSPGFSSDCCGGGWESNGFFARSESEVAFWYASGGFLTEFGDCDLVLAFLAEPLR